MADEQFPVEIFDAAGYSVITHGQKAWNGVAILSRSPAILVQRGLPGQEEFGARLLSARIQDLYFTTVYCPNGKSVAHDDFPRKRAWFDSLAEHMESNAGTDTTNVLCGDFNICPTALDTWDEAGHAGKIFHTHDERQRMQRILDGGFKDVFREKNPDARAYSWWDYRAGAFPRNHGLRIDFLLATPSVMARVKSVEIDRDYRKKKDGLTASDHAPVIADLSG